MSSSTQSSNIKKHQQCSPAVYFFKPWLVNFVHQIMSNGFRYSPKVKIWGKCAVQRNEMKAHAQEKVGCGNRAWPIRGMYGIINRGGRNFSIIKTDLNTSIYELTENKQFDTLWMLPMDSWLAGPNLTNDTLPKSWGPRDSTYEGYSLIHVLM